MILLKISCTANFGIVLKHLSIAINRLLHRINVRE